MHFRKPQRNGPSRTALVVIIPLLIFILLIFSLIFFTLFIFTDALEIPTDDGGPRHYLTDGEVDSTSHRGGTSHSHRDWLTGYIFTQEMDPIEDARILLETHRGHRVTYSDKNGFYSITDLDLTNETSLIEVTRTEYQAYQGEVFIDNRTMFNVTLITETADSSIGLLEQAPLTGILLGAIITILSHLFLHGGDRKYSLLSLSTIPLYTKLDRNDVLSHETRQEIYRYLIDNPGSNYVQIRRELAIGTSTMVHHLRILEREGFIRSRKELGRRLFFRKGAGMDRYGGMGSRHPSAIQSSILSYIRNNGGVSSRSITEDLDLSRSTALYSLSKLRERGFITSDREGNSILYSLACDAGATVRKR